MISFANVIKGISAAALLAVSATTVSAAFPEKNLEILVPWGAGGTTDARARIMAPKLAEILGQNVIVRNIGGASGTIGTSESARGKADGYQMLMTPSGPTVIQPKVRNLPYDTDSFVPVCRMDYMPFSILTTKESKYKTLDELLAAASAGKGAVTYASSGVGTLAHVLAVALEQGYNRSFKHVPGKGSADAAKNLLGGFVDFVPDTIDFVPRFDLKPIAVASEQRHKDFPDVPTLKELNFDFTLSNWQGIYVLRDTPRDVVNTLAMACKTALEDKAIADKFTNMNTNVGVLIGEEANDFYKDDSVKAYNILMEAGLVK